MILNLKQLYQILDEHVEFEYELDKALTDNIKGFNFLLPIKVKGNATNRAGIVTLSLLLNFTLESCCDRCLCEVRRNSTYKTEHILVKSLNEENDKYIVTGGNSVNLDELVLTDILLQVPSKTLCQENCKGLCISCGADLNNSECNCKN